MIPNSLEQRLKRIAFNNAYKVLSNKIHFSFIVERTRIICWGYNKIRKSHPLAAQYEHRFNDIHAELAAISNFPYRVRYLKNFSLFNLRIRRDNGQFAMAMPCLHCQTMLTEFGLNEVYFTNSNGVWSQL